MRSSDTEDYEVEKRREEKKQGSYQEVRCMRKRNRERKKREVKITGMM